LYCLQELFFSFFIFGFILCYFIELKINTLNSFFCGPLFDSNSGPMNRKKKKVEPAGCEKVAAEKGTSQAAIDGHRAPPHVTDAPGDRNTTTNPVVRGFMALWRHVDRALWRPMGSNGCQGGDAQNKIKNKKRARQQPAATISGRWAPPRAVSATGDHANPRTMAVYVGLSGLRARGSSVVAPNDQQWLPAPRCAIFLSRHRRVFK